MHAITAANGRSMHSINMFFYYITVKKYSVYAQLLI